MKLNPTCAPIQSVVGRSSFGFDGFMEENIELKHKFAELNTAWSLDDVQLDFAAHTVTCVLTIAEARQWTVLFKSLVDLHYAPDYRDEPGFVFGDVKFETLHCEDELSEGEGLWVHGNDAYKDDMPVYRVTFNSGDHHLKIVCRSIEFIDS